MSFPRQLVYYNTAYFVCQHLFKTFLNLSFFKIFSKSSPLRKNRSSAACVSHRSFNITCSCRNVKRICCIFLNNFFIFIPNTRYAIFSLFYLHFVVCPYNSLLPASLQKLFVFIKLFPANPQFTICF